MRKHVLVAALLAGIAALAGCAGGGGQQELWIYTSIYREVIEQLEPEVQKALPDVKINWFKAGSEEVAAKINAEARAGGVQADVIMTSDPFYYEGLKREKMLLQYRSPHADKVPAQFKDPDGYYTAVRLSTMIIAYNERKVTAAFAPKGFMDLVEGWEKQVVLPDALKSGTAFTTVAFLADKYGWTYFKGLRRNGAVASGGNTAVLKSIESGEYLLGVVLLENVLKARTEHQSPVGIVYPKEGAVLIPGPIAILKSSKHQEAAKKLYDFMLSPEGAKAMVRGYMHAPDPAVAPPAGARPLGELLKSSFPWTRKFLTRVQSEAGKIKEQYTQAMLG